MIDIVTTLQAKATIKEWIPIVGSKDIQNFTLSLKDLTTGSSVLLIDLPEYRPLITDGFWSEHDTTIDLMLVRKFEDNTRSSIKETTEEKYNNRLYELINNLDAFLIEVLACSANMKVISVNYNFMQNVFAKSVDGVLCKLTFEG